ncbi:argininosuccinate lyase [Paracoccus sp. (in: a-proteobacteria)]|nr:argininosuccinate lyase [Paracoccus sp. (in: a-proteobacteria)]
MKLLPLIALLALGACGVDGPPVRPGPQQDNPPPGLSVSGEARIGVVSTL